MKSVEFLDQLATTNGLKNDNQIAVFMGWPNGTVANYRKGRRIMDNEACLAVALKLEIEPLKVIMAADIDRAARSGQQSLWQVFLQRMPTAASILLAIIVTLFLTPQKAESASLLASKPIGEAQSLYYVKLWRRLRRALQAVFSPASRATAR